MYLDPTLYRECYTSLPIPSDPYYAIGHSLLLPDILAAVPRGLCLAFPTSACDDLAVACENDGRSFVQFDLHYPEYIDEKLPPADVLYLGTPQIVRDRPNPTGEEQEWGDGWTKAAERHVVKTATYLARNRGYKAILCGLRSGDIDLSERQYDMESGLVIAYKHFGAFEQWLLVKEF